jgi:endonuclease/exonuclease/phosphatase family metal-dependent hydrolase
MTALALLITLHRGGNAMPKIKICSFNVEWMNDWFTSDSQPPAFLQTFKRDGGPVCNTAATATRAANLIRDIDPDVLGIREAPSRPAEMELFIQEYLSDNGVARYSFFMGDSGGAQKLALLYKPNGVHAQLAPHASITGLIDPWMSDVDGDFILQEYQFTRTPLVVNLKIGTHDLQVIVAHTKSNFVNKGAQLWSNPATRQSYVVAALKSRRRISSEAMHMRSYINSKLKASASSNIIVMGDLNDGPGLDYFEQNYLTHNVIDILMGSAFDPEMEFVHAQHDVPRPTMYTATFDDFVTAERDKKLLLDHILLSPGLRRASGLRKVAGSGKIHHVEYKNLIKNDGLRRDHRPSDHTPVSVELR